MCRKAYQSAYDAERREEKRAASAAWYAANRDRALERSKAYQRERRSTPEFARKRRDYELRKKYGITLEQYEAMLESQGGCAICTAQPAAGGVLDVDHCHDTGRVRGLLCNPCNRAIGLLRHDMALIEKAVAYLGEHA